MPQPEASAPDRPLTDVARLALDEAHRQGASEAEADVSVGQGLPVVCASGGSTPSSTSATGACPSRCTSAAQGLGQQRRPDSRCGARECREGLRDRAFHGRGSVRRARRAAAAGARDSGPGSGPPLGARARARHRGRARCEEAGLAVDSRIDNPEGASVETQRHTAGRRLTRLSRRFPPPAAPSVARSSRRRARTCSVTIGTAVRAILPDLDPPKTFDARGEGRRAPRSRHLTTRKAPVALCRTWRVGASHLFVRVFPRRAQYRQVRIPVHRPGSRCSLVSEHAGAPHVPKGLASAPFDGEGAATAIAAGSRRVSRVSRLLGPRLG